MFKIYKFIRSILNATRGFNCILKEQNFKIQIFFAIIVLVFILVFDLKSWEVVTLLMMITLVLVLEIINSIFEKIMDILRPRVHPHAKTVKDMMAAAVLVAALGALFVGFIIFWPHFVNII